MILDQLENLSAYSALSPRLPAIIKYLSTHDLASMAPGEYDILPDKEAFVRISDSPMKPPSEAKIEFHRQYIDIQLPFTCVEKMGWMPLAEAPDEMQYDCVKDCALSKFQPECQIAVKPGQFVIFFPQDVHAPCLGEGMVRKAIIKFRV